MDTSNVDKKSLCEDCGSNDSVHNVYFVGMLDTPVPLCKHCRKQLDETSNTNSLPTPLNGP
jgi:hypothetical protein